MKLQTWNEYRGYYQISGDRIYVDRLEVDVPLWNFPLYQYMEPAKENWLVYGPAVRTYLYDRFYGGGHHYVFPFIKPSEIWIESNMYPEDIAPVYTRHAICRYLMREPKLSYAEADLIGRTYETDLRISERAEGHTPFKQFHLKKQSFVLRYSPPTRNKTVRESDRENIELREFRVIRDQLLAKKDKLVEPEWEDVFKRLEVVESDLSRLPI